MVDLLEIMPAQVLARDDPTTSQQWVDLKLNLQDLCRFEPRDGQVECIWHILAGQRDVFFQAATGYGKSLIWQYAGLLCAKEDRPLTIMVTPLTALTQQQITSLPMDHGVKGMALYAHNFTDDMLGMLVDEEFTHVCLGPEIAASRRFAYQVLQKETVRERRIILLVDEVHTVTQWMSFRKDMAKMGLFRQRIPPATTVVGMSATLPAVTKAAIVETGLFRQNSIFITSSVNRPEIFIEIRPLLDTKTRWLDLRFLFPISLRDSLELPKTIIFFNSRCDIRSFLSVAMKWLFSAGLDSGSARQTVKSYYAPIPQEEKDALLAQFAEKDSPIRVMLATDAMGMGIELSSIEIVVQYGDDQILKSLTGVSTIVQRMGRAARKAGESGYFVWLVPKWALGEYRDGAVSSLGDRPSIDEEGPSVPTRKDRLKWKGLDKIYQNLFTTCPRSVLLTFFHEGHGQDSMIVERFQPNMKHCCFRCNPEGTITIPNALTVVEWQRGFTDVVNMVNDPSIWEPQQILDLPPTMTLKGVGPYYTPTVEALRAWRAAVAQDRVREAGCGFIDPSNILSDEDVDRLAQMASFFMLPSVGEEIFKHFMQHWEHVNQYHKQICRLLVRVVPGADRRASTRSGFVRHDRKMQQDRRMLEEEAYLKRWSRTYRTSTTMSTGFYRKGGRSVPAQSSKTTTRSAEQDRSVMNPTNFSQIPPSTMPDDLFEDSQPGSATQEGLTSIIPIDVQPADIYAIIPSPDVVDDQSGRSQEVIPAIASILYHAPRSNTVGRSSMDDSQSVSSSMHVEVFTTRSGRTSRSTAKARGQRQYLR